MVKFQNEIFDLIKNIQHDLSLFDHIIKPIRIKTYCKLQKSNQLIVKKSYYKNIKKACHVAKKHGFK
jgi:hypothetical protein